MQHKPWIGRNYHSGIAGMRALLFGFSHHGLPDHVGFTEEVVGAWARGEENIPFCPRIRSYFGMEPAVFWHGVAFANTLPTSVGEEGRRYYEGTPEQIASVPDRVLQIIGALRPDRIFVFSRKAWKIWPDYTGTIKNGTLRVPEVGEFDAGSYSHRDGEAIAFGFSHPQYAPVVPTTAAVQAALAVTPAELATL